MISQRKKKALLIGIAGSNNAFSLSLYNLKSYAYADEEIRKHWDLPIIQHPLINQDVLADKSSTKLSELRARVLAEAPDIVAFSCYMWNVRALKTLGAMIRKDLPAVKIIWGGPEIATDCAVYLSDPFWLLCVIRSFSI